MNLKGQCENQGREVHVCFGVFFYRNNLVECCVDSQGPMSTPSNTRVKCMHLSDTRCDNKTYFRKWFSFFFPQNYFSATCTHVEVRGQ